MRPFLLLGLIALGPACGDDADREPGSELGPCLQGQFCESPLQCVQDVCVHPDQLDGSEGGDPSGPVGDDGPLSASESMSATAGMSESATASATGDSAGTTSATGADGTTGGMTAGDATAGDATADDATAGECVPPECSAFATKMTSCYPMLDIDWYAQCLETADICHIDGPCVVPATVTCSIAMPCDVVVDGGCIEDAC